MWSTDEPRLLEILESGNTNGKASRALDLFLVFGHIAMMLSPPAQALILGDDLASCDT